MSKVLSLLMGLSALVLAGCASQPSSTVEGAARSQFSNARFETAKPLVLPTRLYSVTPQLVLQLQERTPDAQADEALKKAVSNYQYRLGPGDVLGLSVWGVDKDAPEGGARPLLGKAVAPAQASGSPVIKKPAVSTASHANAAIVPPAAMPTNPLVGASASPASGLRAASSRPDLFDRVKPVPGLQFLRLGITQDGQITLPYLGTLKVSGLAHRELIAMLTSKLKVFVPMPVVDLRVLEYRSQLVTVTGEVARPGPVAIDEKPLTLLELVGRVGPLKDSADQRRVQVIREGKTYPVALHRLMKGEPGYNVTLRGGDLVNFPDNSQSRVFILGELNKQGRTVLTIGADGLSLGEALATKGGVNALTADPRGVFVMRASKDEPGVIQVFQLDIQNAAAYVMADRFPLRPRDYVYVSTEPVSAAKRVLDRILPSVGEEVLSP